MDDKKLETSTNDVVVTNPVPTAVQENKPVEAVAVQNNPAPAPQPVVETLETPAVEPVPPPVETPVVEATSAPVVETLEQPAPTNPVISPVEDLTEETEVKSESEEMIDKNKKIISASPQMVDSSTIDVNAGIDNTTASETNVVSETVIDADINSQIIETEQKETTFEEVSLSVEGNSLDLTEEENDPNSIFNKVDPNKSKNDAPAKIGEEKHKFPFFMVFVFIIMIVAAFNMETIAKYIKEYQDKKNAPEEEEQKKDERKEIQLKELLSYLDESSLISSFEGEHNIEITISLDEVNNKLTFAAPNYLENNDLENFVVTYTKDGTDLVTTCGEDVLDFCNAVTTATVINAASLGNSYSDELEKYIKDNISNGVMSINGFSETTTAEGIIFRISLIDEISIPKEK